MQKLDIIPGFFTLLFLSACGISGGPSLLPVSGSNSTPMATPIPLAFSNFQTADIAIGQTNLSSMTAGAGLAQLSAPRGNPLISDSKLYLPDTMNTRVLTFNTVPTISGAAANISLTTQGSIVAAGATAHPQSIAVTPTHGFSAALNGGTLGVAGDDNAGFLGWSSLAPTPGDATTIQDSSFTAAGGNGCFATNTSTAPEDILFVGNKMVLSDGDCNRILIWNSVPSTNATTPDLILGQVTSTASATGSGAFNPAGAYLSHPTGMWSDGTKFIVADKDNNRILIWNAFPTTNSAPDLVLGQADFTTNASAAGASGLSGPTFLTAQNDQLIVADSGNHRVLIWDSLPTTSGVAASKVLGQSDFTHHFGNDDVQANASGAGPTARTFKSPSGIYVSGKQLFVMDTGNNRVVIFNTP